MTTRKQMTTTTQNSEAAQKRAAQISGLLQDASCDTSVAMVATQRLKNRLETGMDLDPILLEAVSLALRRVDGSLCALGSEISAAAP